MGSGLDRKAKKGRIEQITWAIGRTVRISVPVRIRSQISRRESVRGVGGLV